jgi:CDGSH-type Zn-finger protein/mannose-6-phosphate isomerase-like protein (cupin superfamily)
MAAPTIANPKGYYHEIRAGRRYLWCSCGRSAKQPFCDGSHAGTAFLPVPFLAQKDDEVVFCGCKHTGTPPFCDGTHNNLAGGYAYDDPDSEANRTVRLVEDSEGPLRRLDNDCYVFTPSRAELRVRGALRYCAVISPALGALHQAQFYAELAAGVSPVIAADGRDVVLFIVEGTGEVEIGDRRFAFAPWDGIHVRPTEAYRLRGSGSAPVRLFISIGPGADDLVWLDDMPATFEGRHDVRVANVDTAQQREMGDRFYQLLIDRRHGSELVTQFIGRIPLSKGEPHRHLYEEALIFLNGQGVVWTESTKTAVQCGDVLFLPRKQLHSVQCTTEGGFDVVGVIYPGDNPSINY